MNLQIPKGTRDFSPEEKIVMDKIVSTLKEVFELYGYAPLDTPILERFDVLSSKYAGGAEILKETFKLKDQGSRELGLRYDLTVPMCRYIAMNPTIKMPFKRYQIGEVFRDGPVASGRYRQFTQCDVDVVGSSSMSADAEIIALIYVAFCKLNFEVNIKVNNRKLLNDILNYCGIEKSKQENVILSIDKLEKLGINVVKNELKEQKIDIGKIDKIINIINIKGNNSEKNFKQLKDNIEWVGSLSVFNYKDLANIPLENYPYTFKSIKYYELEKKVYENNLKLVLTFDNKLYRKQEHTFNNNISKLKPYTPVAQRDDDKRILAHLKKTGKYPIN